MPKLSMGVDADETEEMIGTAVREISDELSNNLVTRNDATAVQDALDRLDKDHVAENGKLDMAVQNTLGPLYKDHAAENDEIDATVQETSDRLNKKESTEGDEHELEKIKLYASAGDFTRDRRGGEAV